MIRRERKREGEQKEAKGRNKTSRKDEEKRRAGSKQKREQRRRFKEKETRKRRKAERKSKRAQLEDALETGLSRPRRRDDFRMIILSVARFFAKGTYYEPISPAETLEKRPGLHEVKIKGSGCRGLPSSSSSGSVAAVGATTWLRLNEAAFFAYEGTALAEKRHGGLFRKVTLTRISR